MKKVTLLAIAAVAMSFASCKKDYTCTCTYTYPGSSFSSTSTTVLKGTSKSAAKAACVSYDHKDDTGVIDGMASCALSK